MAGQIGQVDGLTSEATERGTAYFVTGSSTDYGWKLTGNSPAILWTKSEYQVLENCVSIQFDDMSVAIDEDGQVHTQYGADESIWNDDDDASDDVDNVEPSSMSKSETGRTLIDVRDFYEGAVGTPTISKAWANAGRVEILGDGILAYHGPRDATMIDEITFVLHDGHWDTQILKVRIEDNEAVTEFGSQLIPNQMDELGVEVNLDIGSFITEQMMDDQSFIQITGLPPGLTYNSARMRIEGKISEDVIVGQPYRISVVIHSSQKQMLTSSFEWMVRDARSSDQRSSAALALPPMNMTDDAAAASVLFSVAASSILAARSFQLDRGNTQSSSPNGGSAADRFNLLNVAQSSKADNSIAVGSDGDDLLDLRLNLPSGAGAGDDGDTEEKSELSDAVMFASGIGGEQIDASSTAPAGSLNLNDAKTDTGSTVTGGQINKAPFTGSPANVVTLEDGQLDTIDVLASAFDQESDILSIASATVDVGSVTINADQTLSYVPDPDFNGVATITYTVRDTADNFSIGSIGVDVVAVNDAPTGGTLPISPVGEDGAVNVNVLSFASDIDGDVLTVVSASAGQGSVVINGDNTLTYNPSPDYNGTDTVTYTLSDGNGGTVTGTFSVAVSAVNDIPVGVSDTGTVLEDGTIVVDVLANDFDIDSALVSASVQILGTTSAGDPLVVIGEGVWTVNSASGEISFTPEANYAGSVTPISYTVNDTSGASSVPVSVSVSITEINDAPVAVSESGVVIEDSTVAINALANDTDLDGVLVPASVQIVGTASAGDPLFVIGEGTWTVNTINGDIMFTPEPNYAGSVTDVTYTVRDEDGAVSNAVSVSVSITEINDVPTGLANTGVVVEDASITIDVLANDTDLDGTLVPASVQISGTALAGDPLVVAGQGTWTVNISNGEITFTPEPNYAGSVTDIAYTVSDEDGGISAPIAVSVSITEINDAPVAVLESGTVIEDGSVTLDVLANDTDLDGVLVPASVQISGTALAGDPLVVAGQGTWAVNTSNGEITFTPEPNYSGSVTDITYTVRDEDGAVSNAVSVSVSITEINDVPTGLSNTGIVAEDGSVTLDVLANDTDLDGVLVSASVQISGTAVAGDPLVVAGQGTWAVNTSNGEITFTPEPNYAGAVTDIAYTVSDEDGGVSAPIAVSVSISSVNDLPVAVADTGTGTEEVALVFDVLANDSDLDGVLDPASVFLSGTASAGLPLVVAGEGVWSVNIANGEVTFTPEVNFNGTITPITYTVSDFDGGTSVPVSLSGSLAAVNDAPLANVVPAGATNEDTLLASFDVLSSASDVEGDTLTVTAASAANGVVIINGDGTLNYTPSANYNGTDTITYTIDDGNGGTDTASVSIVVAAVNDAPVAGSPPLRNTLEDTALNSINVLSFASDIDGDVLSVTASSAGNGSVVINGDGTLNYTPSADFNGLDTVSYTVDDGAGGTVVGTFFVFVTSVNDAPVASADIGSVPEDGTIIFNIFSNDTDVDGTLVASSVQIGGTASAGDPLVVASEGVWTVNTITGQISFTPEANYTGPVADITYTVEDNDGAVSAPVTVSVTITNVNDAPVAGTMASISGTEDVAVVSIDVLALATDAEGDTLAVTIASATNGAVVINGDNTLTYTPNADYNGSDTITYTISDGNGGLSVGTVPISLAAVNDAPVAGSVAGQSTAEETTISSIDVLSVAVDVDGDTLSVSGASALNGVVTINGDNTLNYTPNTNYFGPDTITYTIDDGNGGTDVSTVAVTISSVNDAPILDLSDREQVISNGSFSTGSVSNWTDWVATGPFMNSGVASNAPAVNTDSLSAVSTLTQTGVTGLSSGPGSNGAGLVQFDYGWNNHTNNDGKPKELTLSINGIDYVRITTPNDDGPPAYVVYLNGASGPTSSIPESSYANWTYYPVVVNLPASVADTGNVVFTWRGINDWENGIDDVSIDNVQIIVDDSNPADSDHSVNYQNGDAAVGLLDGTASIVDLDGSTLQAAQVVLTFAESGDQLRVSGATASNGASGTVNGLSWSSVISGGAITVNITGAGTHADYLTALNQIQFYSSSGTPVASTRVINITIDDGVDNSAIATTRVVFGVDPDAPNTVTDTGSGSEDVALVIDVLANDSDGDAAIDPTSVQIYGTTNPGDSFTVAGEGTWSVNAVTGAITFTGEPEYNGTPTAIQYDVADVTGHRSTLTTVTATLAAVNDAPIAVSNSDIVIEDNSVAIDVLANDSDIDGTLIAASVHIVGTASAGDPLVVAGEGTWTVNGANGEITFTPLPNYTGSVTDISYTVDDNLGATSNAVSISISIDPVNDAPVAVTESAPVAEDSSVIFLTLSNDVDVDGTLVPASVQIVGTASAGDSLVVAGEGTWSVNTTNGNITFTPLPDFEGVVTDISYTVQDDSGATSNPAVVSATITPVNDAPTDIAFAGTSIDENSIAGTLVSTLSSTDIDTGDTATYSIASDPSGFFQIVGNELQVAAGAAIDYEVLTSHSVDVTVTDSGGLTHTETVVIGVNNLLDFIPSDIIATGNNGTAINIDGGNAAYYQATNGSAVLGGSSSFTVETQFSISDYAGMLDIPLLSYATATAANEVLIQLIDVNSSTPAIVIEFDGVVYETSWDSTPLLDGGHHTLSVSWDNTVGDLIFYADGVAVETVSGIATGNVIASGGELVFGLEQDSPLAGFDLNQVFSGTFHDIRVFSDIRTPAEIAAGSNQTIPGDPNTSANWQFGEAGNITDVVLGNDLILNQFSGAGWTASTPSAVLGIGEHRPSGTVVADLTTIDADVGDTFTYAITSDPSGSFVISGSQLVVGPSTSLDYDVAQSHDVTIEVTDSSGQTYSEIFTVRVLNEDETLGFFEGTPNVDSLTVTGLSSYVYAKDSNDTITGGAGNDILHGQDGSDTIIGGDGNDIIFGDRQLQVLDSVDGQVVINSTSTGSQSAPVSVALHDGTLLVVWYDGSLKTTAGERVRGQIVEQDGTKIGAELVIGTSFIETDGSYSMPPLDAILLANGNVLVSWVADNTVAADGSLSAIVASVVDTMSNTAGNEFVVNTAGSGQQAGHVSVALDDGRSLVVWNDDGLGSSNSYLQGQFVSASGSLDGSQFVIGSSHVESSRWDTGTVQAVLLNDGNVAVNWVTESDDNVDGSGSAVAGVVVDSTTMIAGSEAVINTTTSTNQSGPTVIALAAGGTLVTWYDSANADSAGQVRGQFVNSNGTLNGAEFAIGTAVVEGNDAFEMPMLKSVELADGNVFVTWLADGSLALDGAGSTIVGSVVDAGTQTAGSQVQINTSAGQNQSAADIVLLNDGRLFATWYDAGNLDGSASMQVKGQFLLSDGNLDGTELNLGTALVEGSGNIDNIPLTATVTTNGDVFVAWQSETSLNLDTNGTAVVSVLVRTATTSGNDVIDGGAGDDYISGGEGDDNLEGGTGADTLDGGAGTDTVSYANAAAGVHVLLEAADALGLGGTYFSGVMGGQTGEAAGDTYSSIEAFEGSNFDDWLFGTSAGVTANLGQGNDLFDNPDTNTGVDIIDGGSGNDVIYTGGGDDILTGGAGDDTLNGEAGNDTATYSGNHADYTAVDLGGGNYTITDNRAGSPDGTDTIFGIDFFQFADGTIDAATLIATSPIAIDLNEDGQINVTGETTSREKSNEAEIGSTVEFDMDGDGDLEVIEWLDGSGDGLLVDNRDGNAATDMNGTRLFGDQSGEFEHGYQQLAQLDENADGVVSSDELQGIEIWVDDGDANVQEGELFTLDEMGIVELSVELNEGAQDGEGRNLFQSTATRADGSTLLTEDVWFASQPIDKDDDIIKIEPLVPQPLEELMA